MLSGGLDADHLNADGNALVLVVAEETYSEEQQSIWAQSYTATIIGLSKTLTCAGLTTLPTPVTYPEAALLQKGLIGADS